MKRLILLLLIFLPTASTFAEALDAGLPDIEGFRKYRWGDPRSALGKNVDCYKSSSCELFEDCYERNNRNIGNAMFDSINYSFANNKLYNVFAYKDQPTMNLSELEEVANIVMLKYKQPEVVSRSGNIIKKYVYRRKSADAVLTMYPKRGYVFGEGETRLALEIGTISNFVGGERGSANNLVDNIYQDASRRCESIKQQKTKKSAEQDL